MNVSVWWNDSLVPLQVDPGATVNDLKSLLELNLAVPPASQQLQLDGKMLSDPSQTLAAAGIGEGDMVVLTRVIGPSASATAAAAAGGAAAGAGTTDFRGLTWDDVPPGVDPKTLHAILQANPSMVEQVRDQPRLVEAARHPDHTMLRGFMIEREMQRADKTIERASLQERLRRDPSDAAARARMDELTREDDVAANWEAAMTHHPESFARVTMLYIDCKVNGHPCKAFIDSGAQTTIIGKKLARECGLFRLLDTRYAGRAVGVGSAPILGRVHLAPLVVGSGAGQLHLHCTFTILDDDKMDFLLGLDMLRRYQAAIDLKRNVLRFQGVQPECEVPFLSEGQLPAGSFGMEPAGAGGGQGGAAAPAPAPSAAAPAPAPSTAAPAPAPAAAASAAALPAATPAVGGSGEALAGLVALGFSAAEAERALRACDGDAQAAASMLWAQQFG